MALVPTPKNCDPSVRRAIQKLSGLRLGPNASPTFAGLTLTDNLMVNANIGVSGDTDLLQLAANALTVNGALGVGVAPAVRLHIQTVDCEETSIIASSTNTAIRIHDSVATGVGPRWGISWMGYDDKLLAAIEPDVVSGWDTHLNFYVRKAGSLYNSLHLDEDGSVYVADNFTAGTIQTDTITEATGAAGVTIDSVVLKDGGITLPTTSKINFRDSDIFIGSAFNGKLDIGADISVGFFYDNADVGDGVDGQSLYINRRAGEGTADDYLQFYISSDRYAIINANQTLKIQRQGSTKIQVTNTGVAVTGNITVTGTVDGIDIATDVAANTTHRGLTSGNPHSVTPAELSLVIGTNVQAFGAVLDDLNTLGVVGADSEFLVGTGAGALAWESGATVRTSLGLGTGDSPQFTGIELGHVSDTTLTRASAGNLNIEGNLIYRAGGIDVPIGDGGTGQSTAQAAIDALSQVSGATNEYVLTKDTASGNAVWKVATGGVSDHDVLNNLDFASAGHTGFQAQGAVLDDLNTLGVNAADSEFLVGTGAGALAWENGATVRTSLGLGTGDNPTFAGLKLESELFIKEQAAADSDQAGYGQFWIKNTTPNEPWFTDDAGTDQQINTVIELPSERMDSYNHSNFTAYLNRIHAKNVNIGFRAGTYIHGATVVSSGYRGSVYSPTQNRIYFVPSGQADEATWHYIDCSDGSVVAYAHGLGGDTPVNNAYAGGVYSPTQNRIYFVPNAQADVAKWHYIDCSDGSVVAYAHGLGGDTPVNNAYQGGVYSPTQNRIYFVPTSQADVAKWHYIDCSDGSVVAYAHGLGGDTPVDVGYIGGVYSPIQNRIYLVPYAQADVAKWHYIDCSDGSVVAYTHGATVVSSGYLGGIYSPTQNRIYLVPYSQADEANWHYIDCSDGSVVAYAHGLGGDTPVDSAYRCGVYSPTQNRIYLVPYGQADPGQTKWHYIDCSDGSVVAYVHGVTTVANGYLGGIYSPTQNRIYLVPYSQADISVWHYIQEFSTAEISPSIAASPLFNKF